MQPKPTDEESQLADSSSTLRFPVLPGSALVDNIESLYEHSRLSEAQNRPPSMASHHDDSSVDGDGSLSSMGESAWDVVDEASAASDDDAGGARNISRQPTPFSEQPEHINFDTGSLAGNDTGSESQGIRPGSRMIEFSHSRKDSSSDPPDTAKQTIPAPKSLFRRSSSDDQQNEGMPYIKFREADLAQSYLSGPEEVSCVLTEFEGRQREQLLREYKLNPKHELAGTVRQTMRKEGLTLDGPFKVLYVGPTEMKDAIVQKLASAFAANHSSSPRDSLNSSRVTVVPISSFADDSSPDVVLIDSMGLDMNIEECKSAKATLVGKRNDGIELTLVNHKTITSLWDPSSNSYAIRPDYVLPDLAAVYIPKGETPSARRTREQAQNFFARHEIATIVISFDAHWKKTLPSIEVDPQLPHLCIESFDSETGAAQVLDRRPIDINTFSNLDSAQLSRSLALLTPPIALTPLSESEYTSKESFSKPNEFQHGGGFSGKKSKSLFERVETYVLLLLVGAVLYSQLAYHYSPGFPPVAQQDVVQSKVATHQHSTPVSHSQTDTPTPLSTEAYERSLAPAVVEQHDSSLATLLQTKFEPNKSDNFQVHVVGDNHVILSPPTWFRQLRRAPQLHFKVHRKNKELKYEFSTLFDGVYALQFLPEEAYGMLDITVWTNRRPRLNESFQVEFGTPWLKVSGWQRAAQAMTVQVREELVAAQTGLFKAYIHANKRVQYFFKDAVIGAGALMKEVEKFGLGSLSSTLKSTEQMVVQSKSLSSSLTQRIMKGSEKTSSILALQRETLAKDISNYSQKVSTMFTQQAKALTEATSSLNLVSLGEEIQSYRETHFREAQKKMLKAWWKVRGAPQLKAQAQKQGKARASNRLRRSARRKSKRDAWFEDL
ncbi:hypothetical protein MMC10_003220 [Thelotrema lepadinum]|nr:hypothetical protein [Thelotrema lepadinum]